MSSAVLNYWSEEYRHLGAVSDKRGCGPISGVGDWEPIGGGKSSRSKSFSRFDIRQDVDII